MKSALFGKSLLKMDIEGAELSALQGAEQLIKNTDTDLAICVYHRPDDIIAIPQYISNLGNYQFYLRQYGFYGMECVLFAFKK